MNQQPGYAPARLAPLFRRVDEATSAVTDAAEGAAAAAADLVHAEAIASRRCKNARCFRTTDTGLCEYHTPENEIEVEISSHVTQRWLRSLAYAEGVCAKAEALDAEVPRIAAEILVDRAELVACDQGTGAFASIVELNAHWFDATVNIRVPLPPAARAVYDDAATSAGQRTAHLLGRYLDRIAIDAHV